MQCIGDLNKKTYVCSHNSSAAPIRLNGQRYYTYIKCILKITKHMNVYKGNTLNSKQNKTFHCIKRSISLDDDSYIGFRSSLISCKDAYSLKVCWYKTQVKHHLNRNVLVFGTNWYWQHFSNLVCESIIKSKFTQMVQPT